MYSEVILVRRLRLILSRFPLVSGALTFRSNFFNEEVGGGTDIYELYGKAKYGTGVDLDPENLHQFV